MSGAEPTYGRELRVKAGPLEIADLAVWIRQLHTDATVHVREEGGGVRLVAVTAPVACMGDVDLLIARWEREHPGGLLPPSE